MEEVLRESESKFRTLAESTTVGVFLFHDRFIYVNPKCAEMSGYTVQELLQMGMSDLLHPDSLPEVQQGWKARKQGYAAPKIYTVRYFTRNKDVRWAILTTALISFEGKPTTVGSVVDITDFKKAELALAEKTIYLDNILRSSIECAIATVDLDFRITYYNPMAEKLFGYTAEEVIGKTVQEMYTKEKVEPERFEKAIENVHNLGAYYYIVDQETEEGVRHLESRVSSILDPDGELLGYTLFSRDITDRKQTEEAIKRAYHTQQVLDQILRISLQSLSFQEILDQSMEAAFTSPAFALLKKGSISLAEDGKEELRLASHYELPGHCAIVPFGRCLCGRAASSREIIFADHIDERHEITCRGMEPHGHYCIPILANGQLLGVLSAYVETGHVRNEEEEKFLTMVAETLALIIGRKQIEEKTENLLRENRHLAQQLLQTQEEERRRLARDLHDEAGQTLTAIQTKMVLIKKRSRDNSIMQQADEAIILVNSLFDLIHTVLKKLNPTAIDEIGLPAALKSLVESWQDSYASACKLHVEDNLPHLDYEISAALYRIVQESLTNITRHAKAEHVSVNLQTAGAADQKEQVELIIKDDGCGMDSSSPRRQGMGLIGMRERAVALGGKFTIESSPATGTRISVSIPVSGGVNNGWLDNSYSVG